MRVRLGLLVGALALGVSATSAGANHFAMIPAEAGLDRVQYGGRFDCNASRCIDQATGALWESTCDRRGCYPLQPAQSYGPPRGYGGGRGGGGGGRFDCNPSRCIDTATGALWESTCDYRGCRPLQPAGQYGGRRQGYHYDRY